MSKYGVFSGPYFPAFELNTQIRSFFWFVSSCFGLNTKKNSVSLRIQSECGKNGPEKTPYLDTFHAAIMSLLDITNVKFSYKNWFKSQQIITCQKSACRNTIKRSVKCQQWIIKTQNEVSLLVALNIFPLFFLVFILLSLHRQTFFWVNL